MALTDISITIREAAIVDITDGHNLAAAPNISRNNAKYRAALH